METRTLPSVCTMDCPDTCSLDVEVQDGRVTKISPSSRNPLTDGFICSKIAHFTKRLYSPDRIAYPMKRAGEKGSGEFARISWDEAVELISERFRSIRNQFGGEAILPFSYGGSNGILGQDTSDKAFFAKLGASRLARTVCAAPTSAAATGMYGKMPGVAFEDYLHAKMILIWGANAKASNIHLVPILKRAKASGAQIAIVDPKLNYSRREYDLHLPVYPGTDLVVALAMIRYWHQNNMLADDFLTQTAVGLDVLLERASEFTLDKAASISRIAAAEIEKLANMYAEANPAVIRLGWGQERNRNGGQSSAAILAMPALLGKFGVQGGGFTLSNGGAAKVIANKLVDAPIWMTRELNMNQLGKLLLEEQNPPIKGMLVYNCNPAATMPHQNAVLKGLAREDLFTVVFDQIMTDTAMYADVLLPAVTFLEQEEIKKSYGGFVLQYLSPVISACGEAKPNEEVFAMLGRGMGWTDKAFLETTEDYLRRAAGAIRGLGKDITLEELREKRLLFYNFPGPNPIQFKTAFPWTTDSKIDLAPSTLGDRPYEYIEDSDDSRYPLALISPASNKTISSSMGEYNLPELFADLHPQEASSRNLKNGMSVRVFNEYGEVHCKLRIRSELRPGVVSIPKGAWRKSSLNGLTSNALSPDTLGTAGGACFNDARVEIAAL